MSIIKVKNTKNYTALSNALLCDKRLTFETRGLLAYLLSKPLDWEVRINDLINASPAGLRVVRRMVAEAEEYGYMIRKRYKNEDGTFAWITEVYEIPTPTGGCLETDAPIHTKCTDGEYSGYSEYSHSIGTLSTDGLPTDGKRTDIVSNELKKTDLKKEELEEGENIFSVYEHEIGPLTPHISEELMCLEEDHTATWVCNALKESSERGKRSLGYAKAILSRWKAEGYGTVPTNGRPKPRATAERDPLMEAIERARGVS